jgi:hypothetical protein
MKNSNKTFRQGDCLVIACKEIPSNLKRTKMVTLALGEVTGHSHTIQTDGCVGYADSEDALAEYIEVKGQSAQLTHQEHSTIEIPIGSYKIVRQTEYTPEELRNVRD